MTSVGILKCPNYTNIKSNLIELFSLHGGLDQFIQYNEKILLKPNLLTSPNHIDDPVITDPRLLLALCEILTDFGCHVTIGDSPAFGSVKGIFRKIEFDKKFDKMGINIIEFNRPTEFYKSFSLDQSYLEYDKIINLPKLKVHVQLLLTLCVKNLFGFISGKRKVLLHFQHGEKENQFAEMLLKIYETIKPTFTILDGIVSMNKQGPRGGVPKQTGYLFSGIDCIAIDRVVIEALGLTIDDYRILKGAKDFNIGEWDINNILILGEKVIPHFELEYPLLISISFSPYRIIKSVIKNFIIKRKEQLVR